MREPSATYRLQMSADCGFEEARRAVEYLHALGVTELYSSPILQARPGSSHGYDVTDPSRLNGELGKPEELDALVAALHQRDMGLLLDIVPNHMAVAMDNEWWLDVLRNGRASAHARAFDVDWEAPRLEGRILVPILDAPYGEVLEAGRLRLVGDDGHVAVRFEDWELPLDPATVRAEDVERANADRAMLHDVLERQAFRLAFWRIANDELNYRRFFDITDLIAIRVEDAEVFEASHRLVLDLAHRGAVTGVRVDHVDGLRDPAAYLARLREALPAGAPIYVEKILGPDERLPEGWPVAGTTGYEAANALNGVLIDETGLASVKETAERFAGDDTPFATVVADQKRRALADLFGAETGRLTRLLSAAARKDLRYRDVSRRRIEQALVEMTVALPVYRTYVTAGGLTEWDRAMVRGAAERARAVLPPGAHLAVELLERVLLFELDAPEAREAAMRWQQLSGATMAKGFEDTALYRWIRLASMNEVGGEPDLEGGFVERFHAMNEERLATYPLSLTATATHDTKRGEDTRARIDVLSEMPDEWAQWLQRWHAQNRAHATDVRGRRAPSPSEEMLVYQTIIGAWPLDPADEPQFPERVEEYVIKAAREAKVNTTWTEMDEEYEQALRRFVRGILGDDAFRRGLARPLQEIAWYGALNSLSQTLLKCAAPGVPDVYQGTERWSLTLVDPDNRRGIDLEGYAQMLREVDDAAARSLPKLLRELRKEWRDGRIKLYTLATALRARRAQHDLFVRGAYVPLSAGKLERHVVAFARRHGDEWAVAIAPRLVRSLAPRGAWPLGEDVWGRVTVPLPANAPPRWRNAYTGETVTARVRAGKPMLPLASALASFPVALLLAEA